jgi:hypothetical protein
MLSLITLKPSAAVRASSPRRRPAAAAEEAEGPQSQGREETALPGCGGAGREQRDRAGFCVPLRAGRGQRLPRGAPDRLGEARTGELLLAVSFLSNV